MYIVCTLKTNHVRSLMFCFRMKNIVKRAQMITSIQELHKEVYMLQNELESLLLKTFPTLYTTPQNASIQK